MDERDARVAALVVASEKKKPIPQGKEKLSINSSHRANLESLSRLYKNNLHYCDNDDATSGDDGNDAVPPSATQSKAGLIVGIVFAVVILVIAAVVVYIYYLSVDKGNAGIPHTSTMAGSVNRGVNNQMNADVDGDGNRIVDSISNQMYSAPTPNGGFNRSCSVKSSGVLYAIPIEDAEAYVGANHSGAPSEA